MNYYYLSNLTTVFLSVILAFFILFQGRKTLNLLFALYSFAVAAWAGAKFLSWVFASIFLMRASIAFAVFIPTIYFHFSIVFTGREPIKKKSVYFLALLMFLLSFSPLMVSHLREGQGIVPGPFYAVFALYFMSLIALGFYNFYRASQNSELILKNQARYLMLASVAGFGGGSLVFVSNFYPGLEPIGYALVPLYSLIAAYAIVKHQLLDITFVIRGGMIYSLLTLLLTCLYFFVFVIFRDFFSGLAGLNYFMVQFLAILFFILLFQPLRNKVQDAVDRIFYREKIDREAALVAFSKKIAGIINIKELSVFIIREIKEVLRIKDAVLYIRDTKLNIFWDSRMRQLGDGGEKDEILLPIYFENEKLAVLAVKGKLSGEQFSLYDLELLQAFINPAAAALKNAFLVEELVEDKRMLYQASNLASLGTLAAGMAHEIKNPLAVIKGLTQVMPLNINDPEYVENFVKIVPDQIDRINNTIDALLKIGKAPALKKAEVDLNRLLLDVAGFVLPSLKSKKITVDTKFSELTMVWGDYNMLYQAFFNLIQNAGQAMLEGGTLTIETVSPNRVRIIDTGCGIAEERLPRLFSPFVSFREDGVGMGLFMVRKILEEHSAQISVRSKIGEGTTFTVDFGKNRD